MKHPKNKTPCLHYVASWLLYSKPTLVEYSEKKVIVQINTKLFTSSSCPFTRFTSNFWNQVQHTKGLAWIFYYEYT